MRVRRKNFTHINLPGKTIVFAMTKDHAERVRDVFEEMYSLYTNVSW